MKTIVFELFLCLEFAGKGPEGPLPRHDHLLFAADIRYQPMAQAAPTAVSCPLRETPIEKADGDPRGVVTSRV